MGCLDPIFRYPRHRIEADDVVLKLFAPYQGRGLDIITQWTHDWFPPVIPVFWWFELPRHGVVELQQVIQIVDVQLLVERFPPFHFFSVLQKVVAFLVYLCAAAGRMLTWNSGDSVKAAQRTDRKKVQHSKPGRLKVSWKDIFFYWWFVVKTGLDHTVAAFMFDIEHSVATGNFVLAQKMLKALLTCTIAPYVKGAHDVLEQWCTKLRSQSEAENRYLNVREDAKLVKSISTMLIIWRSRR